MQECKIKSSEDNTQFFPSLPNNNESNLHIRHIQNEAFNELINPTEDTLLLKRKESGQLNIQNDDKIIDEMLLKDFKNTKNTKNMYKISLSDCFLGSSSGKNFSDGDIEMNVYHNYIGQNNLEEEIKEDNMNMDDSNKNGNENIDNCYDLYNDLFFNNEKDEKSKEDAIDKSKEKEKNKDFIFEGKKENKEDVNYNIIDINRKEEGKKEENDINQFKENDNVNIIKNNNYNIKEENKTIKNNWENKDIIDINEGIVEEIKQKKKKEEDNKTKKQIKSFNNKYNIMTLNIIGVKNDEYYIGKIIEKARNFPSNLGIIKSMDLDEFSNNYYGEKLQFEEIVKDNDFEKILKLIPVGQKKYIFLKDQASKAEIYKEENNIIILHGRSAQEIYYYIMKLTGQIDQINVYTLFKVKNNFTTINHFKDTIGLSNDDISDNSENNVAINENLDYGIVEDKDTHYYIISGHLFLTKYRKILKKQKEIEEKRKDIEKKNEYNIKFDSMFSELNGKYNNIIDKKNKEIELKLEEIEKKKKYLEQIKLEEQQYIETYKNVENDKNQKEKIEEDLKIKILRYRKDIKITTKNIKEIDKINRKNEQNYNISMNGINFRNIKNREEIQELQDVLDNKEKTINSFYLDINCSICQFNKRDVIFCECSHFMVCGVCLQKISEEKASKIKAVCPACNKICKRFFLVKKE